MSWLLLCVQSLSKFDDSLVATHGKELGIHTLWGYITLIREILRCSAKKELLRTDCPYTHKSLNLGTCTENELVFYHIFSGTSSNASKGRVRSDKTDNTLPS
ncbi:hypothetical protein HBI37_166150 [Parastagonospora nodorum]|nr:hypothetical protein HBI69_178850 [Parastagonospora nodorum]KAH6333744.1 hypothetical protein HBI37_166150 [Parastagonospora nodorum]KAH6345531.1 hypothetical protein HBI36_159330 [Parastagonospora nodorum]